MTSKPGLGFIDAPINRAAGQRGCPKWLEERLADPVSRMVVFVGDRPLIAITNSSLSIDYRDPQSVSKIQPDLDRVLVHVDETDSAVFAVQIDEELQDQFVSEDVKLIDLRSLAMQAELPTSDLGALAQARSLLAWHAIHKFCANCGTQTVLADAGYRRDCPDCQRQHFPRVDPVVIMLVRHGDNFLMGRGHNFSENHFSALAGFLEPGETIEAATRRETFEETGIRIGRVDYLISQPWPFPSSLMIGVLGKAETTEIKPDKDEIAEARWFSFAEIRLMLDDKHPDGTTLPPPMSIAYQMLQQFLD